MGAGGFCDSDFAGPWIASSAQDGQLGKVGRQLAVRSNAYGSRKRRDDAMHATAKAIGRHALRDGSCLLCLTTLEGQVGATGTFAKLQLPIPGSRRYRYIHPRPLSQQLPRLYQPQSFRRADTGYLFVWVFPPNILSSYRSLAARRVVRG